MNNTAIAKACGAGECRKDYFGRQPQIMIWLAMKLTLFFTLLFTLQVTANVSAQKVSLNLQNASFRHIMVSIQKQTNYSFVVKEELLQKAKPVSVTIKSAEVLEALPLLFEGQPFTYHVHGKVITLKEMPEKKYEPKEWSEAAVQRPISGRVVDEQGGPLSGVSVLVKGAGAGTKTNEQGLFSIDVSAASNVLVFSSVGYTPQEVPAQAGAELSIVLYALNADLAEVVVVGYGTQKRSSVTAAISTMSGSDVAGVPSSNVSNNLGGRLSGVIVKQVSGQPGEDGSNIFIRGISTTGSTQPLLVVDGIPRSFQQLDPNSIESFTVLKDAAAVAPYGVAGANGVILVTTKKGQTGKPTVTYNGYVGLQNPTALPKYVNSVQFATLKNDIAKSEGLPLPYSDEALRKFADGSEPDLYSPQKALDYVISDNAPMTYHNVEMSGGTDRIRYYGSLGYLYQEGMWSTANANRYNLSLNVEGKVTEYTTVSLNIHGVVNNRNAPNSDLPNLGTARIMELIGYSHPGIGPLVFSNGMYGNYALPAIYETGYLRDYGTGIFTQLNVEQKFGFLPGLTFRGTVAYDPSFSSLKRWTTPMPLASLDTSQEPYVITPGIFGETNASLSHSAGNAQQLTYQAGLDYVNTFNEHTINVLGVFEARSNSSWNLGAARRNFNLLIDEIDMGSSAASDMTTNGTSDAARQVGLVYRVAYDYAGKYLLEASGRYDGHYYFAPESRFGFFPSFSAGWRISEENFLKDRLSWLNNLKIRGSYGEVGALAGSPFQYLSTYGVSGPGYVLGGQAVQIVSERSEPNPDITWERAKKVDIGMELALLNHSVQLEFDYFYEKRNNMLVAPDVITPEEYGIGLSQVNAGIMENRGVDLTASFRHPISEELRIGLSGTFTYAKNKLIQTFENTVTYNNPNRRRTGRSLNTQFGYRDLGFFQPEDFNDDGSLKPGIATQPWGAVKPGDIRYDDVNGDGKIDINDEVAIGDPNQAPHIIYGFSPSVQYKNWSLEALFQGAAATNLYHSNEMAWAFYNGMNAYVENLDYWTPENRNAKHPRLTGAPTANNTQTSSFWMRDASYLRVKNLTLSYRLNDAAANLLGLQSARVYLSSQNLFTWSDLVNWDPESIFRSYPQQKVFSLGLNLDF